MTASDNGNNHQLYKKILKQIEYYFGDVNLQRDRFLQDEMKKDHGWVPLDVLLTFNRLKQLSEDKKVIVEAIKDSELLDVSDDGEKIRRNPDVPIPENSLEFWNEVKTRTVYVKGFDPETTKLDEILAYLKPYGVIVNVVMRKFKEPKVFKGSIFATFRTVEEAKKLAESEDAKKYNEREMTIMMQKEYWAKLTEENKKRRAEQKALKEQKKIEAIQEEHKAKLSASFIKGQVLLAKNFPETDDYNAAKEFFSKYAPAAFIEIDNEKHEAKLRFQSNEEDVAKSVLKKIQESGEKPNYMDKELEVSVLEGDEEAKYWADFNKSKATKIAQRMKRGKKRSGFLPLALLQSASAKKIRFEDSDDDTTENKDEKITPDKSEGNAAEPEAQTAE